jgi:hypothetical protein
MGGEISLIERKGHVDTMAMLYNAAMVHSMFPEIRHRSVKVSAAPGSCFFAFLAGAFFLSVIVFWRHNHSTYPREYQRWDRSVVWLRCGAIGQQPSP